VFNECPSIQIAQQGLVLPENMDQIKYLTLIGRILRNPFFGGVQTNLNGLIELDISALEIPTCLDIHDINTFLGELYLVQWEEFRLRTIICKNRLQSSISSSNIQKLKLGYLSMRFNHIVEVLLDETSCLDNLKTLQLVGINNISFYDKHMAFGGKSNLNDEVLSINPGVMLKNGGRLFLGSPIDYFTTCAVHVMDEADKYECSLTTFELLKHDKLRASLEELKLGSFIDIEHDKDDDSDDDNNNNNTNNNSNNNNNNHNDNDNNEKDDNENFFYNGDYNYSLWSKVLSSYKTLKSIEMECFRSKAINLIVEHVTDNPPLHLSSFTVKAPYSLKSHLYTNIKNRQKTIDNWFKPNKSIIQKGLTFVYTNYHNPSLSENIYQKEVKRWIKYGN